MKQIASFFLALFFFLSCTPAYAGSNETIRVGITSNVNQVEVMVTEGSYSLVDGRAIPIGYPKKGEIWTFRREGMNIKISIDGIALDGLYTGPISLLPVDFSAKNVFRLSGKHYRDSLIIQNELNGLLAVNNIDLEKYLYGVVGKEMGYGAPLEALKAQAIVSRSYALANKGKNSRYDVGVGTDYQVYDGYEAELIAGADKVKQAVDETAGLVLYYNGQLVNAFFHANAGGYTENSENVWLEELPYIKATKSPYDEYALTYPHQTSSGWPANTYKWDVSYSRQELNDKINSWNSRSSNKIEVGTLTDLKVSRKQNNSSQDTLSGRVTKLSFVGANGEKEIYKDSIRSVLGLKSTLFQIDLDSTVHVLNELGELTKISKADDLQAIGRDGLLSALNGNNEEYNILGIKGKKAYPKIFKNIMISGKGHGHGLGMSQWGAQGMAKAGFKYDEILEHYYNQGKKDGALSIKKYRSR